VEGAFVFVQGVAQGAFGPSRAAFIRGIRRDGRYVAAIFGCEAALEVGFILQVAVRPECQGQGLGATLVREIAHCFSEAGLARAVLGVTVDNPARRLYERLGFTRLLPVRAYVWWG
jgi:ribosomal protein S18 acetylase RimI-like enzyme